MSDDQEKELAAEHAGSEFEMVRAWVKTQGYPLELQVGQLLRALDWQVEHGHIYVDPTTQKPRELDLMASMTNVDKVSRTIGALWLAVQCKRTKTPWVVFTAQHTRRPLEMLGANFADVGSQAAFEATRRLTGHTPRFLNVGQRIGYAIACSKESPKPKEFNTAYAAVREILSATLAIDSVRRQWMLKAPTHGEKRADAVLPLIVLNGSLYEYRLEASGAESLEKVSHSVTSAIVAEESSRVALVRIVTFDHLGTYLAEIMPEATRFVDELRARSPDLPSLLPANDG